MTPEGALITGVLVLSGVVGAVATAELATTTASAAVRTVDTGVHAADEITRDLPGVGAGAGGTGGVTVTVSLGRRAVRKARTAKEASK